MTEHAYIHVPFCRSRCHYCDFYFELEKHGGLNTYVEQLIRELELRYTLVSVPEQGLTSLYFGGGTPSLLSSLQVSRIIAHMKKMYGLAPHCEITLELNPEDTSEQAIDAYLEVGVNRFSVGVQSLDDIVLKKVARRHSASVALACIDTLAKAMGKQANISIDLMYGLPFQSMESWKASIKTALDLPIQHISLYGLQLEAGTALETLNRNAPTHYPLPDDALQVECYKTARQSLEQEGFRFYEVSNTARAGYESQHNLAYWQQKNYASFGPGAHGMLYPHRYMVPEDLKTYNAFKTLDDITETTPVTPWEHLENIFIFGLRMTEGIPWQAVHTACTACAIPFETVKAYVHAVASTHPHFNLHEQGLKLHPAGIPHMNSLLTCFIQLEDELKRF